MILSWDLGFVASNIGQSERYSRKSKMEVIVANVDKVNFDIEGQLEEQVGAQTLPFPGMDSKSRE